LRLSRRRLVEPSAAVNWLRNYGRSTRIPYAWSLR
jgi:hypothetical protein